MSNKKTKLKRTKTNFDKPTKKAESSFGKAKRFKTLGKGTITTKYGTETIKVKAQTLLFDKRRIHQAGKGGLNIKAVKAVADAYGIDYNDVKRQVLRNIKGKKSKANVKTVVSQLLVFGNRVERFLANFDISVDDLLKKVQLINPNITKADLLNEDRWQKPTKTYNIDGPVIFDDGTTIDFYWDYDLGSTYTITAGTSVGAVD